MSTDVKSRGPIYGILVLVGIAVIVTAVALGLANRAQSSEEGAAVEPITFVQYMGAVRGAAECVAEVDGLGYQILTDASGLYVDITITNESNDVPDKIVSDTYDRCWAEYAESVASAWYEQNAVTTDQLPAVVASIYECVEDAGVKLPGGSTDAEAVRESDAEAAVAALDSLYAAAQVDAVNIEYCIDRAGFRAIER